MPGESHRRGAWWAAVHGVAKSPTRLGIFTFTSHFHALEKEMETHSGVLAWRIPGTGGSLVGCRLWGHTGSDTTEATQQQQQRFPEAGSQPSSGVPGCWCPLLFLIPLHPVEVWGSRTDTQQASTTLHPRLMRSSQLRPVSPLLLLGSPVPSLEVFFWSPAAQHRRG